jgi:hypothetical protein
MTADFVAVLAVLLLSGGEQTDAVSFLPPRDYFQSRKIKVSTDSMMELAARPPADPKAQVQQLLALRVLGEEAEALKDSPKYPQYRRTLEDIAAGNKAQDAAGFARDYAARTLARIDGKHLPARRPAALEEGLGWFPENASVVAMVRSHAPEPAAATPQAPLLFRRFLSAHDREALFPVLERIGNVQVDRITAAFGGDNGKDSSADSWLLVRVSGKVNQAWLRSALAAHGAKFTEARAAAERPVAVWNTVAEAAALFDCEPAALAVVGNTDLLLVVAAKKERLGATLESTLARCRQPADGTAFRRLLKKVPPQSIAFLVGEMKEEEVSYSIQAQMQRSAKGLQLDADLAFATESEAEQVETDLRQCQQRLKEDVPLALVAFGLAQAVDQTKDKKDKLSMPEMDVEAIIASLERIKFEAQGNKLRVRAPVPTETWVGVFGLARGIEAPPVGSLMKESEKPEVIRTPPRVTSPEPPRGDSTPPAKPQYDPPSPSPRH